MKPTRIVFSVVFFLMTLSKALSQEFVKDDVGILSAEEVGDLSRQLADYEEASSVEVAIRIVDDQDLSMLGVRHDANTLFVELGLGKKELDNGILIYHAPKNRKVTMELGYGIEPFLSDLQAKDILDSCLVPTFQKGSYYEGFKKTLRSIELALDDAVFIHPERDMLLIDQANILTGIEKDILEDKLQHYLRTTGHRIWVRIIPSEQEYTSIDVAEEMHQALSLLEQEKFQHLFFLGVGNDSYGKLEIYPHLIVDFHWYDLVKDINRVRDYYRSKYRMMDYDTQGLITYRLEHRATTHAFEKGDYFRGIDRALFLLQKVHQKEIKYSVEVDRHDWGWWYALIGHPIMIIVSYLVFMGLLVGGIFYYMNRRNVRFSGLGRSTQASYSGNSGGGSSFGGGDLGEGGGSLGGSSSGGSFGGGNSGGGGASSDY